MVNLYHRELIEGHLDQFFFYAHVYHIGMMDHIGDITEKVIMRIACHVVFLSIRKFVRTTPVGR